MQARNEPMAKMRFLHSTRNVSKNSLDRGAISVHWPLSKGSLQESWRISAVLLRPPPATRTRCLSPPACSSSIPGRSLRRSFIFFSFRHRHASPPPPPPPLPPPPLDVPTVWVSSSAHRVDELRPNMERRNGFKPPTTRTASDLPCRHNADAFHLPVGMLGRSTHLQEKALTCWVYSLMRY